MPIPNALDVLRLPDAILVALDSRALHFALQPVHHLIRLAHLLSAGGFFGAIALLDLQLIGASRRPAFRSLAEHAAPWLYGSLAVALASGALLFLYDPVHVGSHRYFMPKLLLLALGLANAVAFHMGGYAAALTDATRLGARARLAGTVSLAAWIGAMACASLNVEAMPKVLLW
jgi:hypothetical protein